MAGQSQGTQLFTVTFVWKGAPLETSSSCLGLKPDSGAEMHFRRSYDTALDFVFNNTLLDGHEIRYLGFQQIDLSEDIGPTRLDAVQISYPSVATQTVSIHFKPKVDPEDFRSLRERARWIALFLSTSLYGQTAAVRFPTCCLHEIRARITELAPRRVHALPYSTHTYVSLCDLDAGVYEQHRSQFASTIYSLLFAHADGVDTEQAAEYLAAHAWSSTDFFTSYYQPGAMVSVSRPYPPELHRRHRAYFLQTELDDPTGEDVQGHTHTPRPTGGATSYDMLAEYPPLRYLGLLTTVFVTIFEENLRHAYEKLLQLQKEQPLSWRVWRVITRERELNRIGVEVAIADNFEHLRLPVTRDLVKKLIDSKVQENIANNVRDLKNSNLNALVFVLTIIATLAGLWSLLPVETIAGFIRRLFGT